MPSGKNGAVGFGIDALLADPPAALRSARIGLVTNDIARTSSGDPTRKALQNAGFNLVRLFGPEHGLSASAADGDHVADGVDALTNLPITSLYGSTQRPPKESLEGIDVLIFDIPDVGARFYTYIWTLSHIL